MRRRARRAAITALLGGALLALVAPTGAAHAASASKPGVRVSSGVGNEAALANPWCDPETALASSGSILGPGGATVVMGPDGVRSLVFAAWTAPRVGYAAGGARSLYVRPLTSVGLAAR